MASATAQFGPSTRFPINTLLGRIGAKWPKDVSILKARWPLPLLKLGVWEIAAEFSHLGKVAIMASPLVLQRVDEMFYRIGPTLWPDGRYRSAWLFGSNEQDYCKEYNRDLYFSVDVDRGVLLLQFREYMLHALGGQQAERSRIDPDVIAKRLDQAKAGFARLRESRPAADAASSQTTSKSPASNVSSYGHAVRGDGVAPALMKTAQSSSLVIDLTEDDSDMESSIVTGSATKGIAPKLPLDQPSPSLASLGDGQHSFPASEEELERVLANIKIVLQAGYFSLDTTTMTFEFCYGVEDLFVLVESRLSEQPVWRGKVVRSLNIWSAKDPRYSHGRLVEDSFRSMLHVLIVEGVKETVVDIDFEDALMQ